MSACFCDVISLCFFCGKTNRWVYFQFFYSQRCSIIYMLLWFPSKPLNEQIMKAVEFVEFCSVFLFFYLKPFSSHLSLLLLLLSLLLLLLLHGAHTFLVTIFCSLLFLLYSVCRSSPNLPLPNHSFHILFWSVNLHKNGKFSPTKMKAGRSKILVLHLKHL